MPMKIPRYNGPVENPVVPLTNSANGPDNKFPEKIEENFVLPDARASLTYSTKS